MNAKRLTISLECDLMKLLDALALNGRADWLKAYRYYRTNRVDGLNVAGGDPSLYSLSSIDGSATAGGHKLHISKSGSD